MFDNESYDPQVIYREVQNFKHPSMIALVAAIDLLVLLNIMISMFLQKHAHPTGTDTNPLKTSEGIAAAIIIVSMFLLNWFMLSLKLIIEVRIDYLMIYLWPGFKRKIDYTEIAKIEIVQPSGILAKNSWGYHWFPGRRYYRAPGAHDNSIQITLNNNLKILLSSKEPEMVAKQIRDAARSFGNKI